MTLAKRWVSSLKKNSNCWVMCLPTGTRTQKLWDLNHYFASETDLCYDSSINAQFPHKPCDALRNNTKACWQKHYLPIMPHLLKWLPLNVTSRLYLQCMTWVPFIKDTVLPSAVHVEETWMDKLLNTELYCVFIFSRGKKNRKWLLFYLTVFFFANI